MAPLFQAPHTFHADGISLVLSSDGPENILVDAPNDQRSRWSGGNGYSSSNSSAASPSATSLAPGPTNAGGGNGSASGATTPVGTSSAVANQPPASVKERQWIILKLHKPAVLRTVTFGKFSRAHPCNVREFKIYVGLSPSHSPAPSRTAPSNPSVSLNTMHLVHWGGLKNDSIPETFQTSYRNKEGVVLPAEYVAIEPISAHSSNYNISIWHIAVSGNDEEELVRDVYARFNEYREVHTNRLILKHLRQRGLLSAFRALETSLSFSHSNRLLLESPLLTQLHHHLVENGDFDAAEQLLSEIAYPEAQQGTSKSLLDEACKRTPPEIEWTRLDTTSEVSDWNGESPSPRGGHQLVLVRPPPAPSNNLTEDDESESEDTAGGGLYLFGGWDGVNELSDFWRFDLTRQRWEKLSSDTSRSPSGETSGEYGPSKRSCHQMAVDEETGDIYLLGKFVDRSRIPDSSVSAAGDRQTASAGMEMTGGGLGGGTGGRRAAPIPIGGSEPPVVRASPGVEEAARRSVSPTEQLERARAAAAEREVGADGAEAELDPDFWVYHTRGIHAGRWEKLSSDTKSAGGPPLIFDHQMLVDPVSRCLFVFGGKHYTSTFSGSASGPQAHYSGLYRYSLSERTWSLSYHDLDPLSPDLSTPSRLSRIGHSMLLDPHARRLLVLAGQRGETYLSDMWAFDLDTGKISCVDKEYSQSGGPDGGFTQRATMDAARREFVLLSGLCRDRMPPHYTSVKNAIWIHDLTTNEWRRIDGRQSAPATADDGADSENIEPKPRFAHQLVYDPVRDEHYLFGGNPADSAVTSRLGDFWRLKLHRTTKDDILRRCRFLIRRCKFYEMCESEDSMSALLYLQTSLASVTAASDQTEFLACMKDLLAAPRSSLSRAASSDALVALSAETERGTSASSGDDDEMTMSTSQILDQPASALSRSPAKDQADRLGPQDLALWQRRTKVFEDLLAFFPVGEKQPDEDLVSTSVAWEGV